MSAGKAGILWKLDRVTGKFIDSRETVYQNVMATQDPVTGEPSYRKSIRDQKVDQWLSSCPGPEGGKDWQAASYHPPTDTIILPLSQSCVLMLGNGSQTFFEMPGTERNMGRLSAYRTVDMKPLWSFQQRSPFLTGVLSTGGDLAFVGDYDRSFRAVDIRTGKTLWTVRLGYYGAGLSHFLQHRRPAVYRRHYWPRRRQSRGQTNDDAAEHPPPQQRPGALRLRASARK